MNNRSFVNHLCQMIKEMDEALFDSLAMNGDVRERENTIQRDMQKVEDLWEERDRLLCGQWNCDEQYAFTARVMSIFIAHTLNW